MKHWGVRSHQGRRLIFHSEELITKFLTKVWQYFFRIRILLLARMFLNCMAMAGRWWLICYCREFYLWEYVWRVRANFPSARSLMEKLTWHKPKQLLDRKSVV